MTLSLRALFAVNVIIFVTVLSCLAQEAANSKKLKSTANQASSQSDSASLNLRGETEDARTILMRRRAFVESAISQSFFDFNDSTLHFQFTVPDIRIGLSPEELARTDPQRTDPVDDYLREKQTETPGLFDIGRLLGQGLKALGNKVGVGGRRLGKWALMPSKTEVSVMKVLWAKQQAITSSEIYANLDSLTMTMADLSRVLENMAARGLLTRKQISPKNEFTILGTFKIEMSRKNAKNREHVYTPLIDQKEMLTFLDASVYLRKIRNARGDGLVKNHLKTLMSMLAPTSEALE